MHRRGACIGLSCLLLMSAAQFQDSSCAAQTLTDEGPDLRIVEVRLRDRTMLAENLIAWQQGKRLFLPAADAFALLGFQIEVAPSGKADGWFLRENQRFALDPANARVEVAGRDFGLAPADFAVIDGAPHISLEALNRWFSLGATFLADRQVVVLTPPYMLPGEEAARRAGARTGPASASDTLDTQGFVALEQNWRLLGWPHITANLALSHDGATRQEWGASAQMLAVGDLLFATARLAASYDSRSRTDARLTLGRSDADGGLLGPLDATFFELGDVASDSLPLISRNGSGLGLRFGHEPVTRADSFDQADIIGDATPGWQAELYRDGELLSFQEIGPEGRFIFPGVPLRFGSNRFRVQLYGPAGERDVINRVIDIADALIQPGALRYSLSLYDTRRSLLGSAYRETADLDGEGARINDGLFAEATLGFGLSRKVSLTAFGAYSERSAGTSRGWIGAGGTMRLPLFVLSADLALQDDGAAAGQASLVSGLGPISLSVGHTRYSRGFESEQSRFGSSGGIASSSEASLDMRLPYVSVGFALAETRQFNAGRDRSAELRLSGTALGLAATHRLAWRRFAQQGGDTSERIDGTFSVSGSLGPLRLRGGLDYDIAPRWQVRRARAEANYRLADWYLLAGFDREFVERTGQWRLGTNRDWNGIRLGLEGRYDDRRNNLRVLATLSFALDRGTEGDFRLGRDARSDRGRLLARAFHDRDGDGTHGPGEPSIPLRFLTDPRGRSAPPREDGAAMLEDLPTDVRMAVTPDPASNPDPFLVPRERGYTIMARPGAVSYVDVPLVDSADAEIILADAAGTPLAGVVAELRPCRGGPGIVARAAHDGLAYYRQILPGCYRLARPDGFAGEIELTPGDVARRTIKLAPSPHGGGPAS